MQRFVSALANYHAECRQVLEPTRNLFPIEVDLSQVAVKYNTSGQLPDDDDEEDEEEVAEEAEDPMDVPILDLGPSLPGADAQARSSAANDLDSLLGNF